MSFYLWNATKMEMCDCLKDQHEFLTRSLLSLLKEGKWNAMDNIFSTQEYSYGQKPDLPNGLDRKDFKDIGVYIVDFGKGDEDLPELQEYFNCKPEGR